MKHVERKVILARGRMLVLIHVVGQRWVEDYHLWWDGRIFVLEEFCPCSIYGRTWLAEVKWQVPVHLSVYCVAGLVEEKEIVEFDRGVFVRKRDFGNY